MRYRWRKWLVFDCNWKVAMEAFAETYHVPGTHPEFTKFGDFRGWARAQGKHGNIGYDAPKGLDEKRVIFRYSTADGRITTDANPNGSIENIAGICNAGRNVLGMMPHPDRSSDPLLGMNDGFRIFEAMVGALAHK